jgi:hypothetical protein
VKFIRLDVLPLGALQPFPGNARRGDVDAIAESLATFGQYRSLIVRQADDGSHVVLAGNHTAQGILRLAQYDAGQLDEVYGEGTAARLGGGVRPEARCEIITCDDGEARKINAADNRLAELGGYDDAALLAQLSALAGDFTGTGWTEEDLRRLADPVPAPGTFVEFGQDIETDYKCPQCAYEWSGKPK